MPRFLIVLLSLSLSGCATDGWFRAHSSGLLQQKFTPCPTPPRCKSSDATGERHAIAPLRLAAPADQVWVAAVAAARAIPRARVARLDYGYLHLEIDSPWNFYVDDLELHLRAEQGIIAIRSSGRIGWYDFNVNKDRIEGLRSVLATQGLVTKGEKE